MPTSELIYICFNKGTKKIAFRGILKRDRIIFFKIYYIYRLLCPQYIVNSVYVLI